MMNKAGHHTCIPKSTLQSSRRDVITIRAPATVLVCKVEGSVVVLQPGKAQNVRHSLRRVSACGWVSMDAAGVLLASCQVVVCGEAEK